VIQSYSAVGTANYRAAYAIGTLTNQPAVTTYTYQCPPTWYSNTTNVLGGATTDGKCKKLSAKPLTITPWPLPGTPISSYGFTWYDEVWAYGTAANGGAAIATPHVTPASCHF